jgi:chromosome segregation ATPase
MALTVTCPSCGLQGLFPDEWSGRVIQCARCHAALPVTGSVGADTRPGAPAGSPESVPGPSSVLTSQVVSAPVFRHSQGGIDTLVPLDSQRVTPPPSITLEPPEDEPGEKQWIGEEAQRFKAYVSQQFAALEQKRYDVTALHAQLEAKSIVREQELNRQHAVLVAKTELLRQREAAIAQQEAALTHGRQELAELEQTLREFEQQRNLAEQEIVDLRRQGQAVRAEVEQLQHSAAATREAASALEEQRRAFRAEQEAWSERLALWERRQSELDREEKSLQRRTAEIEELEERIRTELDERARELDHRERLVREREERLGQTPRPAPGRPEMPYAES